MADSNSTKHALANALKTCMTEKSFCKISVSDICARCDMNRKSFYYHFCDKYELLHWIFDCEYAALGISRPHVSDHDAFSALLSYLEENRAFYRKAFEIKGQNSLEEHFRALLRSSIATGLTSKNLTCSSFSLDFLTDGCLCAILRWLFLPEPPPAAHLEKQLHDALFQIYPSYE